MREHFPLCCIAPDLVMAGWTEMVVLIKAAFTKFLTIATTLYPYVLAR